MTQLEVADAIHMTNRSVSDWEKDRAIPSRDALKKLAELFQLKLDDFAHYLSTDQIQEYAEFTGTEVQRRRALELAEELLTDPRKLDEWVQYGEWLRQRDSDKSQ